MSATTVSPMMDSLELRTKYAKWEEDGINGAHYRIRAAWQDLLAEEILNQLGVERTTELSTPRGRLRLAYEDLVNEQNDYREQNLGLRGRPMELRDYEALDEMKRVAQTSMAEDLGLIISRARVIAGDIRKQIRTGREL